MGPCGGSLAVGRRGGGGPNSPPSSSRRRLVWVGRIGTLPLSLPARGALVPAEVRIQLARSLWGSELVGSSSRPEYRWPVSFGGSWGRTFHSWGCPLVRLRGVPHPSLFVPSSVLGLWGSEAGERPQNLRVSLCLSSSFSRLLWSTFPGIV